MRTEQHTDLDAYVLVVDDDPNVRSLIVNVLALHDVTWREASDGREALRVMSEGSPSAIVLDLMMPGMNGFQFLTQIRHVTAGKAVPVILLSALADNKRLVGQLPGLVGVIVKGRFSLDDFNSLLVKAEVIKSDSLLTARNP